MNIKRGRLLHACTDCPRYYVIEDTCLTTCCGRSDCVSKKSCVIFDGRLRWDTRISGMDRGLIHRLRGCTDKINRIEASHLITITPRNLVTDTLSPLPVYWDFLISHMMFTKLARMIMSANGNILRVTGPLRGNSPVTRPLGNASRRFWIHSANFVLIWKIMIWLRRHFANVTTALCPSGILDYN